MFNSKDIRTKINNVKNTKKLTRAMEMISTVKLKKNQLKKMAATLYFKTCKSIIFNLSKTNSIHTHSFFVKKKVKNVGLLIVSSNKGLCGSLNTNLFKEITTFLNNYKKNKINFYLNIYGKKALSFFSSTFKESMFNYYKSINEIDSSQCSELFKPLINLYINKKVNRIFIAYNKYKNSIFYQPIISQLLPIKLNNSCNLKNNDIYIYEPNSTSLINTILNHYIETKLYTMLLNNISSEHSARMLSMKSANDNSNNLIKELELDYNKSRQANITQELTEIISSASAITEK